jgi:hypothetical protein
MMNGGLDASVIALEESGMASDVNTIRDFAQQEYKWGFVT